MGPLPKPDENRLYTGRLWASGLWVALPALIALPFLLSGPIEPQDYCGRGHCWGNFRQNQAFWFLFVFPPGWAAFLILRIRDARHLSWAQYFVSSMIAFFGSLFFSGIWTYFILVMTVQHLRLWGLDLVSPFLLLVLLMGYAIIWACAYTALVWLPRPMGRSGDWEADATLRRP